MASLDKSRAGSGPFKRMDPRQMEAAEQDDIDEEAQASRQQDPLLLEADSADPINGINNSSSRKRGVPAWRRRAKTVFKVVVLVLAASLLYELLASWLQRSSSQGPTPGPAPEPDQPFDYILPVPCHSHNDYWRDVPLYDALRAGCVSVEADVWLVGDELLVGHERKSLLPNITLASRYVQPLMRILNSTNEALGTPTKHGVFISNPEQTLVLLIDFKTAGQATFETVVRELAPFRDAGYLSYWNGTSRVERAITVVASGEATLDNILSAPVTADSSSRHVFLDAPLQHLRTADDSLSQSDKDLLGYKYNPSNSYYASGELSETVGTFGQYLMGQTQVAQMRSKINDAQERGLVSRYWGQPLWPTSLRDRTWTLMLQQGIGMLNVDSFTGLKALVDKLDPKVG